MLSDIFKNKKRMEEEIFKCLLGEFVVRLFDGTPNLVIR